LRGERRSPSKATHNPQLSGGSELEALITRVPERENPNGTVEPELYVIELVGDDGPFETLHEDTFPLAAALARKRGAVSIVDLTAAQVPLETLQDLRDGWMM
jgi:hypothetical protein